MHMIKHAFSAIRRFKHNIWSASLNSSFVSYCIIAFHMIAIIVALILIMTWPWPVLTIMIMTIIARLIYAGATAR